MKKNCKNIYFSVTYRTVHYAEHNEKIDLSDPQLISDANLLKKVQTSHSAIREKIETMKDLLPIRYHNKKFNDATDKLVDFINKYIIEGWHFKRPQCYIWGPSNVGKTTMVDHCLGAFDKWRFTPPRGKDNRFMWSEFNPKKYNHVVIDEFKHDEFSTTDLNLLLSGEVLVSDQKFKHQQKIYMRCPIIICSNYPPEETCKGFVERLYVIEVKNRGWIGITRVL